MEHKSWEKESFQKTFSGSGMGTKVDANSVAKKDKIEPEVAEFRAARLRLSENNPSQKVEKVNHNITTPFSSLTRDHVNRGWYELIITRKEGNTDQHEVWREIRVPHNDLEQLFFYSEENIPLGAENDSGIKLLVITKKAFKGDTIKLPIDAWNLANFNTSHYRTDGIMKEGFLNVAERVFQALESAGESIPRSSVCVSKSCRTIFVLPKIIMSYD